MSIEQKSVEILDKLDKLATQYTPDVIDSAITSVQVTAIGNLLFGVIHVIGLIISYFLFKKYKKEVSSPTMEPELIAAQFVLFVVVAVISIIGVISIYFDIWNYVSIINPKLGLAHKVLGL